MTAVPIYVWVISISGLLKAIVCLTTAYHDSQSLRSIDFKFETFSFLFHKVFWYKSNKFGTVTFSIHHRKIHFSATYLFVPPTHMGPFVLKLKYIYHNSLPRKRNPLSLLVKLVTETHYFDLFGTFKCYSRRRSLSWLNRCPNFCAFFSKTLFVKTMFNN